MKIKSTLIEMLNKVCLPLIIISIAAPTLSYKIPQVKLELLENGFRLSIPDEPGVKNVAFNVNRNRPFNVFGPGEFSTQIRFPINGRWTYDFIRKLKNDDIIYIWINVQHEQLSFRNIEEPIIIKDVKNNIIEQTTESAGNANTIHEETSPSNSFNENKRLSCKRSTTVYNNIEPCVGELIFEENFNTLEDFSRWQNEIRLPLDSEDAEFVVYHQIAKLSNGVMSILPKLWNDDKPGTDLKVGELDLGEKCTGSQDRFKECIRKPEGRIILLPPIVSARINTKESFSFKYGRIEISAKLPQGDWLFPALEPLRKRYGTTAYASGQIRIAFARGNADLITENGEFIDGRRLYGGAIFATNAKLRENSLVNILQNRHFGEDFHTYSLIWNEQNLTLKVDNEIYGIVDGGFADKYPMDWVSMNGWKTGGYMVPLDQEFYITLGVAAGGHTDFPDNTISGNHRKPWLNTSPQATSRFWRHRRNWKSTWSDPALLVDYVRVWALDY